MKRQNHKVIVWLRVCVLAMFCPAFLWRCATVMNLEGGPIDTLPPVIVSMLPDNFTTNFTASKIYVTFDEFVQLKDQQKEFFTSPQMKKKPQLSIRGRGILIQIKDTLKENTTYALNFGSAVRDNNEGNPLYSMRYVFSTGPEVDSMVVSGYTADSYTADSVAKSFIYFFPADSVEDIPEYDSTMFKYQPAVIARAETNGIFIAQNLKPIPYRVYAFEDKNNNQIYEPSVDQVGFLTGTYNPAELPDFGIWYDSIRRYVTADPQLYFRMFTDEAFGRQYLRESERPVQHKALLYFNAGHPRIDSIVFDSIPADRVIIEPQSRPLIGRPWALGSFDCWGLVMAWHKEQGVTLNDFRKPYEWWKPEHGENLYFDNWQKEGFVATNQEPQPGDMVIFQLSASVWNHAGIYLGDNQLLHHMSGKLSRVDIYSGWYQEHAKLVCRHKDLK